MFLHPGFLHDENTLLTRKSLNRAYLEEYHVLFYDMQALGTRTQNSLRQFQDDDADGVFSLDDLLVLEAGAADADGVSAGAAGVDG